MSHTCDASHSHERPTCHVYATAIVFHSLSTCVNEVNQFYIIVWKSEKYGVRGLISRTNTRRRWWLCYSLWISRSNIPLNACETNTQSLMKKNTWVTDEDTVTRNRKSLSHSFNPFNSINSMRHICIMSEIQRDAKFPSSIVPRRDSHESLSAPARLSDSDSVQRFWHIHRRR